MSDQKNKQQQPQQGNEKNQSKSAMPQDNEQQGNQQRSGQSQGSGQQLGQVPHKGNMADTKREQPMGSDIENPDRDNDPDRKVSIDDDPEQTKKKVPNMGR